MSETSVDSFILRIVRDMPQEGAAAHVSCHGLVRHLQSKKSIQFTEVSEAFNFINGFIDTSPGTEQALLSQDESK